LNNFTLTNDGNLVLYDSNGEIAADLAEELSYKAYSQAMTDLENYAIEH
jgi:hypothetical protein